MRIAWCVRPDASEKPGGDIFQVYRTMEALEALGVSSMIFERFDVRMLEADIVHLTNLDRPHEMLAASEVLRRRGWRGPLFLSTIHHPRRWMRTIPGAPGMPGILRRKVRGSALVSAVLGVRRVSAWCAGALSARAGLALGALRSHTAQQYLLDAVDRCICLSARESTCLREEFVLRTATSNIPNGVGEPYVSGAIAADTEREGIVAVGRIESRKNSLQLARTLVASGLPGVFIGAPNPNERSYVRAFLRAVGPSKTVRYLGPLPPADVATHLFQARLHVLASWAEVFPLVDLEALSAGAAVMTTSHSLSSDLLHPFARVVDPAAFSPDHIGEAYTQGPDPSASAVIRERFSWKRVAEALAGEYARALQPAGHT